MNIAVVIATYQRPDGRTPFYLNRTLASIDAQAWRDYRVYVVGDAYANDAELRAVVARYSQMVCHNLAHSPERERYGVGNMKMWCAGGVTAANTGIDMALSDGYQFVAHQGHDDTWEPNHLATLNNMIEVYQPVFCCTLSTYFGRHILPNLPANGAVLPFYPIDGGMIASSACVKYTDTRLRVMDRLHVEGVMSPCDAYLWEQLRNELKANNKTGYITATVTCHHDEEGYVMRERRKR
jgi:glycosyltransferase involved in cell wall biosynthesis